jgi:MoaA/NifB/PqqE/SkfB family radical SAM enzyme
VKITGLHLLLTYECNLRCDHCFVWGSPGQSGVMKFRTLQEILDQARQMGTVEWIYFEGGEPFLHYGLLLSGAQLATAQGFSVGMVSNAFWATSPTSPEQALTRLRPLAGIVQDLSISTDAYHGGAVSDALARNAVLAAEELHIPVGVIRIAPPGQGEAADGQIPPGESAVVYRGRAAERLATQVEHFPPGQFTTCPHENLRKPGRVHLDPLGYVHICQGISLGNFLQRPLSEIFEDIEPDEHAILGPLLRGGPAELTRAYGVTCDPGYADACHLCYSARCALRQRFPEELAPDQMYGDRQSA